MGAKQKITKRERVVRTEAALLAGARTYLAKQGFTEVLVPHLTTATGSCENIDTLFSVDYFGKRAYLVQTGQLYLESLIPTLGPVWCVGPSFRAEPDIDGRHLTEFTLLELELSCDFATLLCHIEGLFAKMLKSIRQAGLPIAEHAAGVNSPFKKMKYNQAIDELNSLGFDLTWGADLKAVHEAALCKHHGSRPLFITHFPKEIKFFNMHENESNSQVVNSADLILPGAGEAVGAAEREWKYERVLARLESSTMLRQLKRKGGSISDFTWYLAQIKRQSVPHAGCGIGLARVVQWVLGNPDIRQCTAYPLNRETLY